MDGRNCTFETTLKEWQYMPGYFINGSTWNTSTNTRKFYGVSITV
jgi:hypothetical protein